jgi:DNA replication protein DnaC
MFSLANSSLLTEKQQQPITLNAPSVDLQSYCELKNIKENIESFISEGNNLLIESETTGNGKTSWAIKLLMSYLDSMWVRAPLEPIALFVNVPTFIFEMKSAFGNSTDNDYVNTIKENVSKCDLIVWDDIGLKTLTAYEQDLLYTYINRRLDLGKSNIFTTNLTEEDFKQYMGDRLYSRIYNNSKIITFYANDHRGIE